MKKLVGKTFVVAATVIALPLSAFAQNLVSQAGLVNRNLERLTLLPGPHLLSPARNTPSMAPSQLKLGTAPTSLFGPARGVFLSEGNSVYLPLFSGPSSDRLPLIRVAPGTFRASPTSIPGKTTTPDFLRFNHRLENPQPEMRWEFQRSPQRI